MKKSLLGHSKEFDGFDEAIDRSEAEGRLLDVPTACTSSRGGCGNGGAREICKTLLLAMCQRSSITSLTVDVTAEPQVHESGILEASDTITLVVRECVVSLNALHTFFEQQGRCKRLAWIGELGQSMPLHLLIGVLVRCCHLCFCRPLGSSVVRSKTF